MKNITKIVSGSILLIAASGLQADQQILDDLIVDGSACIGQDCVNGESFGFDTIRIKENNLRIRAQDTSSTASFPTRDWQLTFNDSSNGGANKFSIDDIDGGRTPFTIEGNAPSHSLYVDDGGRLGLGTSTPVADVHVKSGNTPTVRLEQDGTSGFTAQTWDMAGNEANFFIRDATNGSTLPIRLRPGAPSSAIDIAASGDVGFGTSSPSNSLHVHRTSGNANIYAETTDATKAAKLLLKNPSSTWIFNNKTGDMRISTGQPDAEMLISQTTGNVTIFGELTTGGTTCGGGGCDLVFAPETKIESIEEHAALMWTNSYLPSVGPTPENQPFNLTEKTGGMLNELEKAHIYIEQLHNRLSKLEAEQEELKFLVTSLIQKNEDGVLLTSLD